MNLLCGRSSTGCRQAGSEGQPQPGVPAEALIERGLIPGAGLSVVAGQSLCTLLPAQVLHRAAGAILLLETLAGRAHQEFA